MLRLLSTEKRYLYIIQPKVKASQISKRNRGTRKEQSPDILIIVAGTQRKVNSHIQIPFVDAKVVLLCVNHKY